MGSRILGIGRGTLIALLVGLGTSSLQAAILLQTDFTGRTVTGTIASDITWATLGVLDPGDLTAVDQVPLTPGAALPFELFDTGDAQGHFAVDKNVNNEGPWSVDVPLVLDGTSPLRLDSVDLDWQNFNNAGAFQGVGRSAQYTVDLIGSLSGLIESHTGDASGISGLLNLSFAAPVLTIAETYTLRINADHLPAGLGNNTGLDALTLHGAAVPEPSTYALLALTLLAAVGYRRRQRGATHS